MKEKYYIEELSEELEEKYNDAVSKLEIGKLDEAEKKFKEILEEKEDFVPAYNKLGVVYFYREDLVKAEEWLKKAEEVEVPTDNEKAMLQLQLANIAASKGRWKQAERHYRIAKSCKITEPNIKEQFNTFEKQFKNRGTAKQAGRMGGGFRPGGKRRRPKMR